MHEEAHGGCLSKFFDATRRRDYQVQAFCECIEQMKAVEGAISREAFVKAYREDIREKVASID